MKAFATLLLLLLASTFCHCETISNPFDSAAPVEYATASVKFNDVSKITDPGENGILKFMFQGIEGKWTTMRDNTDPLAQQLSALRQAIRDHNKDADDNDADHDKREADLAAYTAAGGGGTYDQNDPKLAMLNAWKARLDEWYTRRLEWNKRVHDRAAALNERIRGMNAKLAESYADWKRACVNFSATFDSFKSRQELRLKIIAMQKQCDQDKRALEYFKDKVPGLAADVEKMAQDADLAREEGRMLAIDKLTGLALDELISKVSIREVVEKADLSKVKSILAKHGVSADDVGLVLANHKSNGTMKLKTMLEQLSQLRDVASAYDNTTKMQYLEALAGCLGVFVQTPVLKLALVNFEVYSSLMYTGLSYGVAQIRVRQFDKLSETNLKAISKISEVYKKHLREKADLKKQLLALGASS